MSEAKLYYHKPRSTGTIATPLVTNITAAGIAYDDMLLPTYHGKRLDATPYTVRVGFAGLNADWVLTPTKPSDAVSVTPVVGSNACQVVLKAVPAGAQFVYLMVNDIQAQVLPLPARVSLAGSGTVDDIGLSIFFKPVLNSNTVAALTLMANSGGSVRPTDRFDLPLTSEEVKKAERFEVNEVQINGLGTNTEKTLSRFEFSGNFFRPTPAVTTFLTGGTYFKGDGVTPEIVQRGLKSGTCIPNKLIEAVEIGTCETPRRGLMWAQLTGDFEEGFGDKSTGVVPFVISQQPHPFFAGIHAYTVTA